MKAMSTPYVDSGRRRQKQRTRDALIDAARALIDAGGSPTVEQAAEAAGISRTTAYRYFTSQHALLAAAHPETARVSMLPSPPPEDVEGRLDAVVSEFLRSIDRAEAQQRTMLRLSLADRDGAPSLPLRQGRAIGWIAEALEPLEGELSPAQVHQLVLAIRSAIGIEARVWLTDVAALSSRDAAALQRWTAQSLLGAARSAPPPLPTDGA